MKDAGVEIDSVYSSPSFRCIQTATSVLEGLGLKASLSIRIEPGLFEWLAWYQDGFPEWLSREELAIADYNIATDYVPITSVEHLKECSQEKLDEFYHRNSSTAEKIINGTPGKIRKGEPRITNYYLRIRFIVYRWKHSNRWACHYS